MARICAQIARSPAFQRLIVGSIVLAIALVGLETEPWIVDRVGGLIWALDKVILGLFAVEAAIKILAQGDRPWRYFRDPWNTVDFLILVCLLLPFWGNFFVLLRVGRLLRIVRVITAFPRLRMLISTLFQSLPSMGYIMLILGLLFYVYGVAGTFLFGANDPVHFGTLGVAMLSLFTVVTLEGWTTIMNIQIYGCDRYGYDPFPDLCTAPDQFPLLAPAFFISFVLLGAMVVLNLFVGVIISSMMDTMDDVHGKNGLEDSVANGAENSVNQDAVSSDQSPIGRASDVRSLEDHNVVLQTQLQQVENRLHRIQDHIQSLRQEMDTLSDAAPRSLSTPDSPARRRGANRDPNRDRG